MRIHLRTRPALAAAVGLLAVLATAHVAPTTTFADQSQPGLVTANPPLCTAGFCQIAVQGFGQPGSIDRANSEAWSMDWFNGKLYVGDNRNYQCAKQMMLKRFLFIFPYPPRIPYVQCPGDPTNPSAKPQMKDLPPTESAEIWALNPSGTAPFTQSNWTEVYSDSVTVPMTVQHTPVKGPRDIGWRGMSVYTDTSGIPALYVSGVGLKPLGGKTVPPPSLLRTTDGVNFQAVPADPNTTLGDINTLTTIHSLIGTGASGFRGQASFDGQFYVIIGSIQGSGAVFASPTPTVGDNSFQQITPPDMQVFEMEPFNGHLYLGLETNKGYEVDYTDCTTPPPGQVGCPAFDFTQVVPPGAGLSHGNAAVLSMHVYTDPSGVQHLYVGTDGAPNHTPAEIIRINTDNSWDLIVGNPRKVNGVLKTPLSGFTSGFGWYFNVHMWRMTDYQGVLYVGTANEATYWLPTSAGPELEPWMGFNLWASPDGVTFFPVTRNGFDDPFSYGARSIVGQAPYGVFVGTANFYYGLRVWQGQVTPSQLSLAPKNVQVDTGAGSGTNALAWDASPGATVYQVFRSTVRQSALPPPGVDSSQMLESPVGPWPHTVWVPNTYTEIGTSTTPYFVDHSATPGGHYSYYVVAQDASGQGSSPSNVVSTPTVTPLPNFGYAEALLSYFAAHGKLSSSQAATWRQDLSAADARLQSGDAQGSHDAVDTLSRQVMSGASNPAERLTAERVAYVLKRLEKRLVLVEAHVLARSQVG